MTKDELSKQIDQRQKEMEAAAKELNFIEAARIRDEIASLKNLSENKK